jgi:hypothetical protein
VCGPDRAREAKHPRSSPDCACHQRGLQGLHRWSSSSTNTLSDVLMLTAKSLARCLAIGVGIVIAGAPPPTRTSGIHRPLNPAPSLD